MSANSGRQVLIWIALAVAYTVAVDVSVDLLTDALGLASNCNPSAGLCNLRSAWAFCNSQVGLSCIINLPPDSLHTINASLGHMELYPTSSIEIVGNGATIELLTDGSPSRRLSNADPHRDIRQSVLGNIPHLQSEGDFHFAMTGFNNSNYAVDVYDEACVTACPNDVLIFSACDGANSAQADTYFRLFLGSAQVTENDDTCGVSSLIIYPVQASAVCQEYCLHMGCYEMSYCAANVTFERSFHAPRNIVVPNNATAFNFTMASFAYSNESSDVYDTACLTGCPNDVLKFSAVGSVPTYFQLFQGSASVAFEFSSLLEYPVPADAACQEFCLDMGCDGVNYCTAAVTFERSSNGPRKITIPANVTELHFAMAGFVNSNNALDVYDEACGIACPNDVLKFSACDDDGYNSNDDDDGFDTWQDTYFRLFLGATEVAVNDNACDFSSRIDYLVPPEGGCQEFCLRMGCGWDYTSCETTVTISHTSHLVGSAALVGSRLFYFNDTGAADVPSLTLRSLTVQAFGDQTLDGGAMYLEGQVALLVDRCNFTSLTGYRGGAVYVTDNAQEVAITGSFFVQSRSALGGALYAGADMANLQISECRFEECSAFAQGGAVYLGEGNSDVVLVGSSFFACSAYDGGAVALYLGNDHFVIEDCAFDRCASERYGGAISIDEANDFGAVANSSFMHCTSGYGGGVSAHLNNDFLHVSNNTFANCSATTVSDPLLGGGALAALFNNSDLRLTGCEVTDCQATGYGGGISIGELNSDAVIEDMYLRNCGAGEIGGGIFFDSDNHRALVSRVSISGCTAEGGGGGLSFGFDNHWAMIQAVHISNCSGDSGGGMAFFVSNKHATLRDSTVTACVAVEGGGVYLFAQNNHFIAERVQMQSCASDEGGGLYSYSNDDTVINGGVISGCSAMNSGGGIGIYAESTNVLLHNIHILNNTALKNGGGVYSGVQTKQLTVVGCTIESNHAANDGGGVYVETGNPLFRLLEERTYENILVLESPHPYAYTPDPVSHEVAVDGAIGYYVHFSGDSRVAQNDVLMIYTDPFDTLFYSLEDAWPGINAPPMALMGRYFTLKFLPYQDRYFAPVTAADGYFGYRLYVIPIFPESEQVTEFNDNVASGRGGALFFSRGMEFPLLMHGHFAGNAAKVGGAVYMQSGTIGTVMHGGIFVGNSAVSGNGGAIAVSPVCHGLRLASCQFVNNHAALNGGAVWFSSNNGRDGSFLSGNEEIITNCTFLQDTADGSGGALYLELDNVVRIATSQFVECAAAGDGGAITLFQNNNLTITATHVVANIAGACGGGIAALTTNAIETSTTDLRENSAGTNGAGICLKTDSLAIFGEMTQIFGNTAGVAGGGIACLGSYPPISADTIVFNNTAPHGSGLYMYGANPKEGSAAIVFASNTAISGTVFWVNASMQEPEVGDSDGVVFESNQLLFGADIATQAVRIVAPASVYLNSYGAVLDPPIAIQLTDFYGELVKPQYPDVVRVSIPDELGSQCRGRFPFLSGSDASSDGVAFLDGKATFSAMEVSCAPGGSLVLLFTATLYSLPAELTEDQRTVLGLVELNFRQCVAGETIVDGKCVVCPAGSYSLTADVVEETVCTECLSLRSVDSCAANQIVLSDGFWRRYPTSEAILPCLNEVSGCAGGSETGDASCLVGYEGPLCSVCSQGYYHSEKKCVPCDDAPTRFTPGAAFFVAVGGAVVIAALSHVLYKVYSDGMGELYLFIPMPRSQFWNKEAPDLQVPMKILITTYQICSAMPFVMGVEFPTHFARYLDAMSIFNLNVISVIPINCAFQGQYNFMDKLAMLTLAPIALSLLLLLACVIEYTYRRILSARYHADATTVSNEQTQDDEKDLSTVVSRYLTLFFLLTYLVLPFIATTLFRTFLCTDLDPDNEDSDPDDLFLTADMRISCTSDYYKRGVAYAAVMIVVYVVGIPLMYLILLYRSRKEIKERLDPLVENVSPASVADTDSEGISAMPDAGAKEAKKGNVEPTSTAGIPRKPVNQLLDRHDHAARDALMISFLYESYEPQYWYWELVETARRLVLTAVLSVCNPGTSGQALLAILLSLMYLKLYGYYAPYLNDSDDVIAETGQFQLFISFLGALVFQRHLLGDDWSNVAGVLLIVTNMVVFIQFVYFTVVTLREDISAEDGSHSAKREQNKFSRPGAVPAPPAAEEEHVDRISVHEENPCDFPGPEADASKIATSRTSAEEV